MKIAYFCAEFALINDMPSYAGGLGILAGDYVFEAADQRFPLTGVGLYYNKGQNNEIKIDKTPEQFGLKAVKVNGKRLLVEIPIENRTVFAQVWQWQKKSNSVYFLDTNLSENNEGDRLITEQLYAEDRDIRLKQELVLGIGGVRLLKILNINPDLYHLNEGHSAFLCLELLGEKIQEKLSFEQAIENVKKHVVFTNHTLVLEGQELFAFDALTRMTEKLRRDFSVNIADFIKLGKGKDGDTLFSMTTLALNMASLTNAVSRIHGEKARELWKNYPLIHITNGIYLPRWDQVNSGNIVRKHEKNEKKLLALIKKAHGDNWNRDSLLIGWSRRFVPYKRPLALLEDVAKLKQLTDKFKDKIHIVYSAPLDEKDVNRNEFLKRLYELMNGELKGLVTFIPNYRIEVAETLVAGCDIWLNTPIVGREACGTSGMKAALNGTLTLSTNDGWINEIPVDDYGWMIDDQRITDSLLQILEKKILPEYESYLMNSTKSSWKKRMEKSRSLILLHFSTKRMLKEYIEKLYLPTINKDSLNYKKVIAFDVDGTLSEPRQTIDAKMAKLLKKLLQHKKVAVISGGAFEHIKKQVLNQLDLTEAENRNLILLPTNGGGFWTFNKVWTEIASHKLSIIEKDKIVKALKKVDSEDPELDNNKSYGREIQDRDSEITYSALGENAPVELKKAWDPDQSKKIILQRKLMILLPEFEVKIGGTTSIDITPKGMDKAFGISQLLNYLQLEKNDALFFGDAVYPDGNDFPVQEMGVKTIKVNGPEDTKKVIKEILD